ncbi:hypothetical protein [Rhizobium sp. MHM7A]|uniref:hypothetical protein n=1 Tax=Rhizobium sp. MHM7A TaxID=2583233 RepID=UPI001105ABA6|nr:hypothetical protein [Rhizobium sp. MHM7A]TLX16152.1 hypothetical protein FFR93_02165 [Rhizobium sp. MHM7A]
MTTSAAPQSMEEIKERALSIFEAAFDNAEWLTLREARDTLRNAVSDVAAQIDVTSFMIANPDVWELPSLSMSGFKPSLRGAVIEAIATNIVREMPGYAQDRFNSQFDTKLEVVLKSLVDTALTSFDRRPGSGENGHDLYNSLCGLKVSLSDGLDRQLVRDSIRILSEFRDELPGSAFLSAGVSNSVMSTVDSLKTVLDDENKVDELFPPFAPSM